MIPIGEWPERLERAARGGRWIRRVTVMRETRSTQDAARLAGPLMGDFVTAWRQTDGRGRMGRRWFDTGTDGTACSIVLPRLEPERLLLLSAVAVCEAIEHVIRRAPRAHQPRDSLEALSAPQRAHSGEAQVLPGIKWPNDIIAPDGGKLAGILVECVDGAAIVGIGVNVSQSEFPGAGTGADAGLGHRPPRSLAMLGVRVDRLHVLEWLVRSFERRLGSPVEELMEAYHARDRLRGTHALLECGGRRVEGVVESVDPLMGLRVRTERGIEVLPAASTTLAVATPVIGPT